MQVFKKLPLGGIDRRALVGTLEEKGPAAARTLLDHQRSTVQKTGANIAKDTAVLILGGSNGITRAVAVQLLFGEGAAVFAVHYDSAKMQIGVHHAAAIEDAAAAAGLHAKFINGDATRDKTIEEVIGLIKERYRAVHLINGIAAGATKRYEKHGPIRVQDIDIAFDPVLQVPRFRDPDAYRQFGWVDVEVATETEIDRTNKFMGTSSMLWVEPLAAAGLITGESVVAFCDYDYEKDDPVYAMGPLAGAKILQRETMAQIHERFGARTVRICYPAMGTTALGAIPGGVVMYALTAQILKEQNKLQSLDELAAGTMGLWCDPLPPAVSNKGELRLDDAYQGCLPEFHHRKQALTEQQPSPAELREALHLLFEP